MPAGVSSRLALIVQPCWSPGGLNTNTWGSPLAAVGRAGGEGCRRASRRRRCVGLLATRSAAHHRRRVVGRVCPIRRRTHERLCQVAPRGRHRVGMLCSACVISHKPSAFLKTRAILELTVALESSPAGCGPRRQRPIVTFKLALVDHPVAIPPFGCEASVILDIRFLMYYPEYAVPGAISSY